MNMAAVGSVESSSSKWYLNEVRKNLTPVERGGVIFYSFKECVDRILTDIPRGTVKRWLGHLEKRQSKTSSMERLHLAAHGIPGCRYVISEEDLIALIHYAVKRGRKVSLVENRIDLPETSCEHSTVDIVMSVPDSIIAEENGTDIAELDSFSDSIIAEENGTDIAELDSFSEGTLHESQSENLRKDDADELATVGEGPHSSTYQDAHEQRASDMDCLESSGLIEESRKSTEQPVNSCSVIEKGKTCVNLSNDDSAICSNTDTSVETVLREKSLGRLPSHVIDESLKSSMDDLEQFYSVTVQPLRRGKHFSASTLSKFLDRVSFFLNFCRLKYPERSFDFGLVDDFDVVQAYINHMLRERKLSVSTAVRTLSVLINLAKYVHRIEANVDSCPELIRLGNIQRQLMKEENSYRLAVKAGLSGKPLQDNLMYSHILDTLRQLREKFESHSGVYRSRILHDFILISLYVTCMCGRGKELRTLKLFVESSEGMEFSFNWKVRCNVFVSAVDGTFILYENDFKTLSSYGPSKMVLEEPKWLFPYFKLYIAERASLLNGKSHPYMFFRVDGEPFTSSSLSVYLGKVFEREVQIRAGTTKLRHALVTHVLSLPESDSLKLRESLANLMRHSIKHQTSTYNDASRTEKTSLSRDLLNKSVEESTFHDSKKPETNSVIATIGDICAVLDSVSTSPEDAKFFLGRVIRISDCGQEALLMEFRRIDHSESFFRACVESSWWENIDSLVFPLDVVYERKKNVYELRSSAADIYRTVFPL